MSNRKTDTEQIRAANRAEVISALRVYGPVARVDIGRITGLSPATVTAITSELAEHNIIQEVQAPRESSGRGRPRVMIDLNPDKASVLGLKLSINELRLMLGDLKGNIISEAVVAVRTLDQDAESLNAVLLKEAEHFLAQHPGHQQLLVSAGIAIQGFVDAHQGNVVWSPALSVKHVNLTNHLQQHLGCPVELANDANCIAYAVQMQQQYVECRDFIVVMLGYGVGGSLIMNGELYTGHLGAAAEFGHTKYSHDGPQCACGKRGCIEAYVSDYALYRDASAIMNLPATDRRHPSEKQMQKLTELARTGNEAARELFAQSGRVLGYGIANMLALMSPERVVVTGPGVRAYDLLEDGVREGIRNALVNELSSGTAIEHLPWSEDMTGKGIIALALKHFG